MLRSFPELNRFRKIERMSAKWFRTHLPQRQRGETAAESSDSGTRRLRHSVTPRWSSWLAAAVISMGIGLVSSGNSVAPVWAEPPPPPAAETPVQGSYTLAFTASAVSFDLSGMEPDFDPIYRLIVTGTVHDQRPLAHALPDATLVLSSYLEVFQPDTTPLLPDLLQPALTATDLAGFLTGKAALVNTGGKIVYRGSLLAEIFSDNTEHLLVDLYRVGAATNVPPIRLQGPLQLKKGGGETGSLRALKPLASAALAVPPAAQPDWKSVTSGMEVSPPVMRGTAAPAGAQAPSSSGATSIATLQVAHSSSRQLSWPQSFALGAILVLLVMVVPGPAKRLGRKLRQRRGASPAAVDTLTEEGIPPSVSS